MDPKEIRCKVVDWIYLAQDRVQWWALANIILNLQVPQNVGKLCG
jgi:hypothetical protein